MAVCNLFKDLSNDTGNFLMFSQYMEDITKQHAHGYKYKVSPSKFITCNINYSVLGTGDLNSKVPTFFQNYFENGCTIARETNDWNPSLSSNIFWNALISNKLLNISEDYIPELSYIGDINMKSYDVKDGMGYSELYLYLSNDAFDSKYKCSYKTVDHSFRSGTNVEGYPNLKLQDIRYWITDNFEILDSSVPTKAKKFDINSIIILYDILSVNENGDNTTLYKDIPMGIYFPGKFEGGEMSNIITKYVSSSDIYGSGTSYGVRICSRFVATSFDSIVNTDISFEDYHAEMSQLMSKMGENLALMKEISKADETDLTTVGALKETYNMFQNHKVNVPYMVKLTDGNYWFVNGKNTGVRVPDGTIYKECSQYDIEQIISEIDIFYSLDLIVYESDKNGNNTLSNFDVTQSNKLYISAYATDKEGALITLDKLEVNGKSVAYINNGGVLTYELPKKDTNYSINGAIEDKYVSEEPKVISSQLYYPIYYGVVNDSLTDYTKLNKFISPSIYNRVKFNSPDTIIENSGNKIVYCYPKSLVGGEIGLSHIINRSSMDDIIDDFKISDIIIHNQEYIIVKTENNISKDIKTIILDFTNILKDIVREEIE